ncbi:hypothetical protein BGZ80_009507, partial [Entomortierella chlamydospora]
QPEGWMSTEALVKGFLAPNKDILNASELGSLAVNHGGKTHVSIIETKAMLNLFKRRERKTLLIVDEHGMLFQRKPFAPNKFKFLSDLSDFGR